MAKPLQAPAQRPDVFISYTTVDRAWAEWIAWALEAAALIVGWMWMFFGSPCISQQTRGEFSLTFGCNSAYPRSLITPQGEVS